MSYRPKACEQCGRKDYLTGMGMPITGVLLVGLSLLLYIIVTCKTIDLGLGHVTFCGFGRPDFYWEVAGLEIVSWTRPLLLAAGVLMTGGGVVRKIRSMKASDE